jgi:hypothetical protein
MLSPDLELSLITIANRTDLPVRYKVSLNEEESNLTASSISIDFTAFLKRETPSEPVNPADDYYRYQSLDFSVVASNDSLYLSSFWRADVLSLLYKPDKFEWLDEEGKPIARPYPDGELFESMASRFYPVLQQFFEK